MAKQNVLFMTYPFLWNTTEGRNIDFLALLISTESIFLQMIFGLWLAVWSGNGWYSVLVRLVRKEWL